jgi:hypothetical protein
MREVRERGVFTLSLCREPEEERDQKEKKHSPQPKENTSTINDVWETTGNDVCA